MIETNKNLNRSIDDLELPIRVFNSLKNNGINTIEDIVIRTDSELLRLPNFGRKSLNEIREVLTSMSLKLGDKKKTSENEEKPDLLRTLKFDIVDKSSNAFNKSCEEVKNFRNNKPTIIYQEVIDIFTQHKQIVETYERSLKDLF
tara:strand:+ start:44 stop:478 length:435 start_codon:yes stop_codon:yes gene_type:complete